MKLIETKALEQVLAEFARQRDWDPFHNPRNLILALTGEVGELAEIFQWLKDKGGLSWPEMLQIFNTGIGYVLIAKKDTAEDIMNRLTAMDVPGYVIGEIKPRVEDQEQVQVHFPE